MKETQIHWKSTDDEIENMTIEQAIELIEKQISPDRLKGDTNKPRKHMVKAYKIAVDSMKILLDNINTEC